MAAPTCGITVVKRFTYRGVTTEEYSNKYLLTGATPANSSEWTVLFDALVLQEKTLYPSNVSVVRGYGYASAADDATSVWTKDLTVPPNTVVPGTYAETAAVRAAGDAAVWIRWGLDRLNSKGKRVFLRKYFHPAYGVVGTPDTVAASLITPLNAFGAKLEDGTFAPGGVTRVLTDKLGTALVGHASSPYVTTRTLKRRGKRPLT